MHKRRNCLVLFQSGCDELGGYLFGGFGGRRVQTLLAGTGVDRDRGRHCRSRYRGFGGNARPCGRTDDVGRTAGCDAGNIVWHRQNISKFFELNHGYILWEPVDSVAVLRDRLSFHRGMLCKFEKNRTLRLRGTGLSLSKILYDGFTRGCCRRS